MKVLFLDLDGVLNRWDDDEPAPMTREEQQRLISDMCTGRCLDPACVAVFNKLVAETGVKVVVSSSWRKSEDYYNDFPALRATLLGDGGLVAEIIGATEDLGDRDDEILDWLSRHPEVTSYAAVDDDSFDMLKLGDRLVLTNCAKGLTSEDAEKVKLVLERPL